MINPLEHIEFESINDEYCKGKYGEFNVIMMKKNGYINVTDMCQYISKITQSKKTLKHWNENKFAKELIDEVSSSAGIPADAIRIVPKVPNELRGTYVHDV